MSLETLFLDAGGVLIHPNWQRVAEVLGRHGIVADADELRAAEPWAKHALDTPERVRATDDDSRGRLMFELVLGRAGVTAAADRLAAAWAEVAADHRRRNLWDVVPEDVAAGLRRLRGAGLRLAVVSNANGTLRALLERVGLAPHFVAVVDSFEVGVEKPDPRIFRIALERAQARPESTLHVGDLYEIDVVGARAAGLQAVLLDPADLYAERGCRRARSLAALAEAIEAGTLG